ncbi:MAG: radical SAM protein [Clostridia bacterium]|nr:radical SAM protein [Clostridia bacterium]
MKNTDTGCKLCPRECNADRSGSSPKRMPICKAPDKITAARASLHMWEEPCLSGERGSGTVFFSGCPLKCVFCQNREISHAANGKCITRERLCDIFFELKDAGAHNINLVSPTPYIPDIAEAISLAKAHGLDLPVVFNSSGYESVSSLKMLDGLIDVYLPDFKYMSPMLAKMYSLAKDYPEHAKAALGEMVRQCPLPEFDSDGMIKRGVIVRHLVLPGCTEDSKNIISYLRRQYGNSIYISIMSQYTPMRDVKDFPELARKITDEEYNNVVDFALDIGVTQGFIQDGDAVGESFIPVFDGRGI